MKDKLDWMMEQMLKAPKEQQLWDWKNNTWRMTRVREYRQLQKRLKELMLVLGYQSGGPPQTAIRLEVRLTTQNYRNVAIEMGREYIGAEFIRGLPTTEDMPHEDTDVDGAYITPETPIGILAIAAEAGKKQVNISFLFNILPVFFLNMESVGFENGLWHTSFPPVNKPVKWLMTTGAPMWQHRLWRFASCNADGEYRQLGV
ncbi:hypothetical protein BOTNAR_1255g00030 [Botryotinia narcissicola]|uniref:Uncharacterized protein n=1 Tax=Botryotinia narcissicola TaxID=278944 RepID=A0A4Z1HFJ6_9HELO|nr:hypothetical protein BOTNAR_1255g00030 [Botryotinia narcissicola]